MTARTHQAALKSRMAATTEKTATEAWPLAGKPWWSGAGPMAAASEYWTDAYQRSILYWDTLRKRGNIALEHGQKGQPPVLAFDYEMVMDGRELERPVNYALVRIVPEPGTVIDPEMQEDLRVTIVATGISNRDRVGAQEPRRAVRLVKQATPAPAAAEPESVEEAVQTTVLEPASMEVPKVAAAGGRGLNYLDIPAFLRRQAD